MISLSELQGLYDRNRFLTAFAESAQYWNSSSRVEDLALDELILGGRLAVRLGGVRLSRWLFRAALARDPSNARVRYYTFRIRTRRWRLFEELRDYEANPELPNADPETQANWLAYQAVVWASLRDFSRAHWCIARARDYSTSQDWIWSCESDVFGCEDRWPEALTSAERSWDCNPGSPFAAHSLGKSLMNLGRISYAAELLATAAEKCESFEVAQLASWHLCTWAEELEGGERFDVLRRSRNLADQLASLAPLADRETRAGFARIRLDIATLEDSHEEMQRWSTEVRSPFHRKVLENFRKNGNGRRIRLPFRRVIQKHQACLPTSIASALGAMGVQIDLDAITSDITFGGTPEWAAAEWLEARGFAVRFFSVRPDIAARLIQNGIAFVMTLQSDADAHAVAAVGLDEAAGTLIIHDPQAFRAMEYLLENIGAGEVPLGPKGMAIVRPEKASLLDSLLPKADVDAMTATQHHQRASLLYGPAAQRAVVEGLAQREPVHPLTGFLKAIQAMEDGHAGSALVGFQSLLRQHPASAPVRACLIASCRALGNTALMRETLASVVERGILPGIQSQQAWFYPPGNYVAEYADLLRMSAETREQAHSLLHNVIHRETWRAQPWHILGDFLWEEQDKRGAVLAYRIAAGLAASNEHYALSYCNALGNTGREEEGLKWLEDRVRDFGLSSRAVATWVTWINALENWGHPERALAASADSLRQHGDSPELLAYLAPFSARMGRWDEAEALLQRLEGKGNSPLFYEAAIDFYQMHGEAGRALQSAEEWVRQSPVSMEARRKLLYLISKCNGAAAAVQRASDWLVERPAHDILEELYCERLDIAGLAPKKYAVLRRRVKRNPEDGWAWRELAFGSISDYRSVDDTRRVKVRRRVETFITHCERTSPSDPATLRLRAEWAEATGDWPRSLDLWLDAIVRDPGNMYGYRHAWDCMARVGADQRKQVWDRMSTILISHPGRLSTARETIMFVGQRFGLSAAEEVARFWSENRPEDPEIVEASVDLLLEHGQGRTDARRALEMLQSAVKRFPYHLGLRFSLADAFQKLGEIENAEEVLREILRRHPDNSPAQVQLARVHERHGRVDQALEALASAATRDPHNSAVCDAQVQVLLRAGRYQEARDTIARGLVQFRTDVNWRERAISLFSDCGDHDAAIQAAREGIRVFPDGAYLWLLLARTLMDHRRFAAQGEIESCLRRSLKLNRALFVAADWLAMLLVEQRQFAEAEEVMAAIMASLGDPSPAQGRIAWIHRRGGNKANDVRQEMASILRATPWYTWGWLVLMDWLIEDKAWDGARDVLGTIPPELRTNTQFRRQRLVTLEHAGLSNATLDSEWDSLLYDFPEDVSLHLYRYDSLRNAKRLPEAAAILRRVQPIEPDSPYVQARFVEVLAVEFKTREEVTDAFMRVLFAETEPSVWPADYAWAAVKKARFEEESYQKARGLLEKGSRPTPGAFNILASHATVRGGTEKKNLQPAWRTWFPDRGVRELLALQAMVDAAPWVTGELRACFLRQFCDVGYHRLVLKYWKGNKAAVESESVSWAQVGRALVGLNRKGQARRFLAEWRLRSGVETWVIANYVMCFSALRPDHLRLVRVTCRDALATLQHDHCAKYLVHLQAEACCLLGDKEGFKEVWGDHRDYFTGKLDEGEWFQKKRDHLLADLPAMASLLEANELPEYRRMVRSLRWKHIFSKSPNPRERQFSFRWGWILFWFIWLALQMLRSSGQR